ncbi:MAG: FAD-binding oxidoreductase [Deltaproteobacteria bacterium]|nr:FAD-binding oxidoreductase [Deltaproteobacteria bacterium]
MTRSAVEELCAALESGLVDPHPGIEVEGREMTAMLSPEDPDSLCRVLSELHERQIPVLIRGGGTRMGLGNLPGEVDLVLSTRSLSGVRRYLERGWELPIDAGGAHSTIGGAIATAAYGPRCLGFGPVRRNVLGLEVVNASGTLTRCGGRVVKNVTGYDLAKLYTGSLGTLGVISGAWLRLQPRPRAIEVRVAEFSQTEGALAGGLVASRRGSARACVLLTPEFARRLGLGHSLAASWILLVEFAGEASECSHDAEWFEGEFSGTRPEGSSGEEAVAAIDAARDVLAAEPPAESARIRIATLPTKLEACLRPLIKTGAGIMVDPGLGLVHAEKPVRTGSAQLNEFIAVARSAAGACSGSLLLQSLPSTAKRGLDVFGEDPGPEFGVMQRLKKEFDPHGLLNPGRFLGGL